MNDRGTSYQSRDAHSDALDPRLRPPDREVELGFSEEHAIEESKRCYLCYLHYEIDMSKCIYCRYCIDVAPRDCIKLVDEVLTNEYGAVTGLWRLVTGTR